MSVKYTTFVPSQVSKEWLTEQTQCKEALRRLLTVMSRKNIEYDEQLTFL